MLPAAPVWAGEVDGGMTPSEPVFNPRTGMTGTQPVVPTWIQNLIEFLAPKNREPYPLYAGNIPGTLGAKAGGPQYNVDMRGRGYQMPNGLPNGVGRGYPTNQDRTGKYFGIGNSPVLPTPSPAPTPSDYTFGTKYGGNWGGGGGYADYGGYADAPQWLKDMYDNLYSWNFRG